MASMSGTAKAFFEACETGKGWEGCSTFSDSNATFSAQASPLNDIKTLAQHTDWMKAISGLFPDASYDLKSFAIDEGRHNVSAYAVFTLSTGVKVVPCLRRAST